MSPARMPGVLLLLIPLSACNDMGSGPAETAFPVQLYPYEVTYDAAVFKQRRDDLLQQLPVGSLVVATTNDVYLRNGDVDYEFRPSSTFYYLTGFPEPNAVAVLRRKSGTASSCEMVMFVETRDSGGEQWLGPVYGPAGAVAAFGADSAYPAALFPRLLRAYLSSGSFQVVFANFEDNERTGVSFAGAGGDAYAIRSLDSLVDMKRPVKGELEIGLLRRAVQVSVQAFMEGLASARPSMYEYEVEARFDLVLRLNGCPRTAFPSIVASGPNITTIHYTANDRKMQDGDLVMIDFGAEYGYYAADLTRTVPVNGRFTAAQATVYDIVQSAHDAVIAAAAPGVSYSALSSLNRDILVDGLIRAGVISGTRAAVISSGQYRLYIPAGLGHCIGLDVHDPWPGDASRVLRENMVLAIEPHIYLNTWDETVAPAYRGICARIEDDILITHSGSEVLSSTLPHTRTGIEALMTAARN